MRLGLVHFAAHTIAAATHVSSAQPQRPQVFLHLFICASFLQKLGSGAFNSHHHEPKPGIVLSAHEVLHSYLDSHEFLHLFLSFLHFFLHLPLFLVRACALARVSSCGCRTFFIVASR